MSETLVVSAVERLTADDSSNPFLRLASELTFAAASSPIDLLNSDQPQSLLFDHSRTYRFPEQQRPLLHSGSPPAGIGSQTANISKEVRFLGVSDVYCWPKWGVCITGDGVVIGPSASEAAYKSPRLLQLPGISPTGPDVVEHPSGLDLSKSQLTLSRVAIATSLDAAVVWVPWGSLNNFGHFLIDAAPSPLLAQLLHPLSRLPFVTPPLTEWQRGILDGLGFSSLHFATMESDIIHIKRAIIPTLMDTYLQAPGEVLRLFSSYASIRLAKNQGRLRRVLLTRKDDPKRSLANRAELLAWAERRDLETVSMTDLSFSDQASLFFGADVVVAEAGAALANIIFMRPSGTIIQIAPNTYNDLWTLRAASVLGNHCHYLWSNPEEAKTAVIDGVSYPNFLVSYHTDIDALDTIYHGVLSARGLAGQSPSHVV